MTFSATVRGLTIGSGSDYKLIEYPQGVLDTPTIRTLDQDRPRTSGVIAGDDFYAGRPMTFVVNTIGSHTTVEGRLVDLAEAFAASLTEEEITVVLSGLETYTFFGRCRGVTFSVNPRVSAGSLATARCSFLATDPMRYGPEDSQVIGLASNVLPNALPFILGVFDSETFSVDGTADTSRWSVTLEAVGGDLVDPSIAHVGTGQLIFHDLTVPSGETLVIDGFERRALLNGVTPVVPTVAQWWKLSPGSNQVRFAAAPSSSLSSTATLTWRPGYA